MQAVLLPAFCASGSRNPIRIKPYRKQVERVSRWGAAAPASRVPSCTLGLHQHRLAQAWQGWGMAGVTLVLEWSSFWASVPVGCALLGLGSGGIRTLSFPAVSLTGSSDMCCGGTAPASEPSATNKCGSYTMQGMHRELQMSLMNGRK